MPHSQVPITASSHLQAWPTPLGFPLSPQEPQRSQNWSRKLSRWGVSGEAGAVASAATCPASSPATPLPCSVPVKHPLGCLQALGLAVPPFLLTCFGPCRTSCHLVYEGECVNILDIPAYSCCPHEVEARVELT